MASPRRKRKFTVYFDPEQDAALLAWLVTQANGSEAIRRVLQSHLAEQSQSTASHGLDLSDIRSVVEAAVRNILGNFRWVNYQRKEVRSSRMKHKPCLMIWQTV